MAFSYNYSFADGPGPWRTWMAPSIQTEAGSPYPNFTRFHLAGDLDPNHIDGIGPIWLLAHLSLPAFDAPGRLDLNDASINITIRAQDLQANGAQLAFWVIRYLPAQDITQNYYVGLQSTNWAFTGGNFIDALGDEWATISVEITDDMADWTYAGNYHSEQGDWAERYVEYPIDQTIGHIDATLHLVFIGDDTANPPRGFVDIANIEIVTQTEAVPLNHASYQMVIHAVEDEAYDGILSLPDGMDPATASFAIVAGSVKCGEITMDPATGAFTFTPAANFWGPDRTGTAAGFQYIVTDTSGTSAPLNAYVYVAPVNDAPEAYGGSENLTVGYGEELNYTLRRGSDIDSGDSMTFDIDPDSVTGGSITLDAISGRYDFTPEAGFSGTASFAYRVTDGLASSAYKTVTISVLQQDQPYVLPSFSDVIDQHLIPGDYQSFVQWTIRLANAGDNNAAYHYGIWLRYGQNVNQSIADAVPYLERAVGLVPDASLILAELYVSGSGVPKDAAHARQLLLDLGDHPVALYELGVLSDLGFGTAKDSAAAVTYYIEAAKLGNADAMYTVGRRYLAGEGVEYQPDDAYFMLGLGLRFNGGPAIGPFKDMLQYNMNLAAVDLTPARIAELNDAISSWSVGDPTPVNDSPVGSLIPETNSIYINQVAAGTLLAGTDRDGNRLNFQLVEGSVVNGTVVIDAANAQYIFTPAADFLGEASFQYVLSDGHATSEPKLVTIIVNNITSAVADMGSVGETDTLSVGAAGGLLSNDTLASGATTVSVVAVNGANADVGRQLDTPYGKLTINADGSYTFIADVVALIEGEEVTVTTTYVIADDLGNLSASELLITVLGRDGTAIVGSGTLSGTPFADSITGLAGNDLLRGFGGANILDGGAGLDYAVYDAAPSGIFVNLATGIAQQNGYDSIDILLNVENVIGSAFNDVVIGDDNDNVLSGGGGNDVLAGGSGNDILVGGDGASNELIGGTGNDTYIVTASGDTIVELAGGGIDTVRTNLDSHVLKDHVENLVYTGSGNFIGSGNDLNNLIVSGPGDDILNGKDGADVLVGGAGNDILIGGDGLPNQLIGGTGNDTYIITTAGDSIVELVGEGIDTVRTNLDSYVLKDHVENLVYTGNGDFTGIGNSANNVLIGGAGNDFLSGMAGNDILDGGAGANTLLGGQGFDQFRISSIDGGIDRIHDFLSGEDKLLLSEELFGASANFDFSVGTDAAGVGPTFLYDPLSGLVRYDADGTGGTVPVVIARLNPGLTLVADDFGFF